MLDHFDADVRSKPDRRRTAESFGATNGEGIESTMVLDSTKQQLVLDALDAGCLYGSRKSEVLGCADLMLLDAGEDLWTKLDARCWIKTERPAPLSANLKATNTRCLML